MKEPSKVKPPAVALELAPHDVCSGCGACVASCPVDALSMAPDRDGFPYPVCHSEKCVHCGKCARVCPVGHVWESFPPIAMFAARAADIDLRKNSSSGGIFPLVSRVVLSCGGVVYGAALEEGTQRTIHVRVVDETRLARLRGSKYSQSDMGGCFRHAKDDLDNGTPVLFSGCPCQIAGLKLFLGREYDNLFTLDVICHGVASPKVFNLYRESVVPKSLLGHVSSFASRDKLRGWAKTGTRWNFDDGSPEIRLCPDPFVTAFSRDLFSRPSCHHCVLRSHESGSDITLGDFWGGERLLPEWNDETGISAVMVHSEKGRALFEETRQLGLACKPTTMDAIAAGNPALVRDFAPNRASSVFHFLAKFISFVPAVKMSLAIDYILSLPHHLRPSALRERLRRGYK